MTHPDENRSERFELVMRPSEKAALVELARANGRSLAEELRRAFAAWLDQHTEREP